MNNSALAKKRGCGVLHGSKLMYVEFTITPMSSKICMTDHRVGCRHIRRFLLKSLYMKNTVFFDLIAE